MGHELTTLEVVQKAVEDYNLWASRSGKDYDPKKAYAQLKGIFYNKLIQIVQNYPNTYRQESRNRLSRIFGVDDIMCEFGKGAFLLSLNINRPYSFMHLGAERTKILIELQEVFKSENLIFSSNGATENKLEDLINQINQFKV